MALLFARRMAAALDHFSTLPDQNRKRNFGRRLLLIALVLPFGLSGCRRTSLSTKPETSVTAEAGFPRSLRDGSGDEVTLKTRPRRIVSQTLGTDEILWAICPRERIAGITKIGLAPKYCPIADELRAAGITPLAGDLDRTRRLSRHPRDQPQRRGLARRRLPAQMKTAAICTPVSSCTDSSSTPWFLNSRLFSVSSKLGSLLNCK